MFVDLSICRFVDDGWTTEKYFVSPDYLIRWDCPVSLSASLPLSLSACFPVNKDHFNTIVT